MLSVGRIHVQQVTHEWYLDIYIFTVKWITSTRQQSTRHQKSNY